MAEEVERLLDVLEKDEQALKAERRQVSELHEAVKVAEERMTQALAEQDKLGLQVSELQQEVDALNDQLQDKQLQIDQQGAECELYKD